MKIISRLLLLAVVFSYSCVSVIPMKTEMSELVQTSIKSKDINVDVKLKSKYNDGEINVYDHEDDVNKYKFKIKSAFKKIFLSYSGLKFIPISSQDKQMSLELELTKFKPVFYSNAKASGAFITFGDDKFTFIVNLEVRVKINYKGKTLDIKSPTKVEVEETINSSDPNSENEIVNTLGRVIKKAFDNSIIKLDKVIEKFLEKNA